MDRAPKLRLAEALTLGLLHGPAELVPVSSSGHMTVVPELLGWDYNRTDPDLRKAFEVALHAGTYAALLIALRSEIISELRQSNPVRAAVVAAAFIPTGAVGYLLEGPIERRLGHPASVAVGMIVGGGVLAWADTRPCDRDFDDAGLADGLRLGAGQTAALIPGISRNGATLTAARLAGFNRRDANRLSWHVAAPVIGAATGLKLLRLSRRGLPAGALAPFAVGAGASFVSTLATVKIVRAARPDRSFVPFGLYRVALGGAVLAKLRRQR